MTQTRLSVGDLAAALQEPDKRLKAVGILSDYVDELDTDKLPLVDKIMVSGMAFREPDVVLVEGLKEGELDPDDLEVVDFEERLGVDGFLKKVKKWGKRLVKKVKKGVKRVWKKIKKPLAVAAGIAAIIGLGVATAGAIAQIAPMFARKKEEAEADPAERESLTDEIAVAIALSELEGKPADAEARLNEIRVTVGDDIWNEALDKVPDAKAQILAVGVENFKKQLLNSNSELRAMSAVEAPVSSPETKTEPQIIQEKAQAMQLPAQVIKLAYDNSGQEALIGAVTALTAQMQAAGVQPEDVQAESGIPTWVYVAGGAVAAAALLGTAVAVASAGGSRK